MQDMLNNICCISNELNLIKLQPNLGRVFNQAGEPEKTKEIDDFICFGISCHKQMEIEHPDS